MARHSRAWDCWAGCRVDDVWPSCWKPWSCSACSSQAQAPQHRSNNAGNLAVKESWSWTEIKPHSSRNPVASDTVSTTQKTEHYQLCKGPKFNFLSFSFSRLTLEVHSFKINLSNNKTCLKPFSTVYASFLSWTIVKWLVVLRRKWIHHKGKIIIFILSFLKNLDIVLVHSKTYYYHRQSGFKRTEMHLPPSGGWKSRIRLLHS